VTNQPAARVPVTDPIPAAADLAGRAAAAMPTFGMTTHSLDPKLTPLVADPLVAGIGAALGPRNLLHRVRRAEARTHAMAADLERTAAGRKTAVDLNDTVVQNTVVALYALEVDDTVTAAQAVRAALTGAQELVTALLEDSAFGADLLLRHPGLTGPGAGGAGRASDTRCALTPPGPLAADRAASRPAVSGTAVSGTAVSGTAVSGTAPGLVPVSASGTGVPAAVPDRGGRKVQPGRSARPDPALVAPGDLL
jgi:hypothetical protein